MKLLAPFRKKLFSFFFYSLILFIAAYLLFPIYWALSLSLQSQADNISVPIHFYPKRLTFENYQAVFNNRDLLRSIRSSFVIASLTTFFSLFFGSLAAFALAKFRFRFKRPFLLVMLAMTTFPSISFLAGLFSVFRFVRWLDDLFFWLNIPTSGLLICIYMIFSLPLAVWLLTYFIESLPSELFESARIDGASAGQMFYLVLLPLLRPALVSVGLLVFIAAWNEFLFALTFTLQEPNWSTVPVAITTYESLGTPIGQTMAAATLVTLPIVIVTSLFQKRIVAGLTAGAVKS